MKQIKLRNFFTLILSICVGTTSMFASATVSKGSSSTKVTLQDFYKVTRMIGGKKLEEFSLALQEDADTEITITADAKVSFVVRTSNGNEKQFDDVEYLRLRLNGADSAHIQVLSKEITRYSLEIRKR